MHVYVYMYLVLCRIPAATTTAIHIIIITTLVPLRAHIDTPGECTCTCTCIYLVTCGICLQVRLSNRSVHCHFVSGQNNIEVCPIQYVRYTMYKYCFTYTYRLKCVFTSPRVLWFCPYNSLS